MRGIFGLFTNWMIKIGIIVTSSYFSGLKYTRLAPSFTVCVNCNTLLSKIGMTVDNLRTRIQESNMASAQRRFQNYGDLKSIWGRKGCKSERISDCTLLVIVFCIIFWVWGTVSLTSFHPNVQGYFQLFFTTYNWFLLYVGTSYRRMSGIRRFVFSRRFSLVD